MKKAIVFCLLVAMLCSMLPQAAFAAQEEAVQVITLASTPAAGGYTHTATLDGQAVPEYDYTWHADPGQAHEDVKNSPAEYYTGTKPTGDDAVYIAHDIIYYPELSQDKFQKVSYDGETEWVYLYEAAGYENYIFSTLPVQKNGFPAQMMHSEEEAYQNAVLHITKPGTYEIQGQWHGQIWVDLGEDAYADPTQKVTLILNGADITCTVAPGLVFYSVYECDNAWEETESHSHNVDTSDAGANVVLAEGSVNNVAGTNVFRILKTKYKDESSADAYPAQKKSWKIDGAFYSYQSMNISGSGTLNITAGFEALDTEHHLTLNSGNVNIYSQDDGINVNEDGVSVLTVNGGNLHICAGLGAEGDGVDSNGYLVINGGTVISMANPGADSGLDSDFGSFVNGGTVVALGATMDWAESDETSGTTQPVLNLRFGASQSADEAIIITDTQGKTVFAYDPDKDEVAKDNQRTYQGAIVSAPGLAMNESYRIYIGGNVSGTEASGVYDAATVTGFTGATLQGYSGDAVGGFGGGFGGGNRPGGNMGDMTPPDGMEIPDGFTGTQRPDKGDGTGRPDGDFDPSQIPDRGENIGQLDPSQIPNMGGDFQMPGNMGSWGGSSANCTGQTTFTLSQQVNAFSGVSDFAHSMTKVAGSQERYVCSVCGKTFADAEGTVEIQEETDPGKDYTLLIIALFFFGTVLLGALIFGIILVCKKKKA